LSEKMKGRDHSEELVVDGRVIQGGELSDTEPSGSIQGEEFLD
jgi:hypothetical protein